MYPNRHKSNHPPIRQSNANMPTHPHTQTHTTHKLVLHIHIHISTQTNQPYLHIPLPLHANSRSPTLAQISGRTVWGESRSTDRAANICVPALTSQAATKAWKEGDGVEKGRGRDRGSRMGGVGRWGWEGQWDGAQRVVWELTGEWGMWL